MYNSLYLQGSGCRFIWSESLVYSLLDASYEAYASYEYSFLTYFLGSATWLSGYTYFKKDIQNNFN